MSEDPTPPGKTAIMSVEDAKVVSPELPNQPRPARDMKDLLRYAVEASTMPVPDGQTPQSPSVFQPMDSERQKFLESAMKAMTVDLIEVLNGAIKTLKYVKESKAEDDPEDFEEALESITDVVNNADSANDFHKIGGFEILMPCLRSPHTSVQGRTAELIAELVQNNPYCQLHVLSAGFLPVLLNMVDNGSSDSVKVKALYAVSCLVRGNDMCIKRFTELDGFSVLLRAMQSDITKLEIKSSFLIGALCNLYPAVKDDLQKMGWVHQLVGIMSKDPTRTYQHVLHALLALVQDHKKSIQDGRDPKLQLRSLLNSQIEVFKGKEEFQEEEDCAKTLISVIFSDDDGAGGER